MDDLKPLAGYVVSAVRDAKTNPGAARALAVVYVDDSAGQAAGWVSFGLTSDAVNTAAAHLFADAFAGTERYLMLLRAAEDRATVAEASRQRQHAAQLAAEQRLERTLTGRSLAFGEVLVTVADSGEAWMQDPVKGDAGFGLHFRSLSELWRTHPELRPVRWADGRLICAAMAMPVTP